MAIADDAIIDAQFTGAQLRHLRNVLAARLRKRRRQYAKSNFVPEPGRADIEAHAIEREQELQDRLDTLLTDAGVAPKTAHEPIVEAGVVRGCSCGHMRSDESWVVHANRQGLR